MIIGIIGEMGSGKTLSAVYLASILKNKGYYIISNMKNFKLNNDLLYNPEMLKELNPNKKYLIIIDEIYVYADSRRSTSKKNLLLSYLLFQSRKRNLDIIYTAQKFTSIDVRIRNLTDLFILTYYYGIINDYILLQWDISKNVEQNKFITPEKTIKLKLNPKIFKLYDTYEIIDFEEDELKTKKKKTKKEV